MTLLWFLTICAGIIACEKDEHLSEVAQVNTMMIPMRDTLPPVIAENTLLTNTHPWYIAGWVYVSNEATLTIEPGTVIRIAGEKEAGAGLVITRGAKIMARGFSNWPILFQLTDTSPRWSGIVLLGRAPQKKPYPQWRVLHLPPKRADGLMEASCRMIVPVCCSILGSLQIPVK
jgi:hypothetical protein